MSPVVAIVLGLIVGIAAIVFLYIKILPKNVDGKLNNKFLQFLHDYFHFKKLYIESVLRFLFTCFTVLSVSTGFFLLFSFQTFWGSTQSYFLPGLLLIIFGPVVLRITYELLMMAILLVQNVISINNKMNAKNDNLEASVAVSKNPCSDVQISE